MSACLEKYNINAPASLNVNVLLSILAYSFCSGTLLIINKALTLTFPPAQLGAIQFVTTVILCLVCGKLNLVKLTPLTRENVIPYAKYSVLFLIGVYSNMKTLEHSNVDTVIVFRSSTPIAVCFADSFFMNRELPSTRSKLAMLCMLVGSLLYVKTDAAFKLEGISTYMWVMIYYANFSVEMVYAKRITRDVKVELGTSVLLTNLFALPFMTGISLATDGIPTDLLSTMAGNTPATILLVASCIIGFAIGFSAWWCRSLVSATSFTVVGIVNKILTVFLNIVLWDKHSSFVGTLCLLLTLFAGTVYK